MRRNTHAGTQNDRRRRTRPGAHVLLGGRGPQFCLRGQGLSRLEGRHQTSPGDRKSLLRSSRMVLPLPFAPAVGSIRGHPVGSDRIRDLALQSVPRCGDGFSHARTQPFDRKQC